jgi:SprT protein
MDQEELKKKIIKECREFFDYASNIFPKYEIDPDEIEIKFTLRNRTVGRASSGYNYLNFSLFYAESDWEEFSKQTIGHEIAHLYADKMFPGSSPHGKCWKYVMIKFGLPPNIRTKIKIKSEFIAKNKYAYSCKCRTHYLTEKIHNQVLNGEKRYCNSCHGRIFLIGKVEEEINLAE